MEVQKVNAEFTQPSSLSIIFSGRRKRSQSQRTSLVVSILACFLLVGDGTLILYATLLWPPPKSDTDDGGGGGPDPLFVVGVVTFVVCFTLPFVLVLAFMVREL